MADNFYASYPVKGSGGGGGSTSRKVELRTVTSIEASSKQMILASTPLTANFTVLEIAQAPSQFYGDDFIVSSNILSWSGLALDGILGAGDRLTIVYN